MSKRTREVAEYFCQVYWSYWRLSVTSHPCVLQVSLNYDMATKPSVYYTYVYRWNSVLTIFLSLLNRYKQLFIIKSNYTDTIHFYKITTKSHIRNDLGCPQHFFVARFSLSLLCYCSCAVMEVSAISEKISVPRLMKHTHIFWTQETFMFTSVINSSLSLINSAYYIFCLNLFTLTLHLTSIWYKLSSSKCYTFKEHYWFEYSVSFTCMYLLKFNLFLLSLVYILISF